MLLDEGLARSSRLHPDKVALVCGGRRLTYREIDDASNRFARALNGSGLQRGDRVVIVLDNCVEAVISIFGTLRAGGVFVPIGPSVKASKLSYIIGDAEAAVVVADARSPEARRALRTTPARAVILVGEDDVPPGEPVERALRFEEALASADGTHQRQSVIDIDLAALVYTSGSTGVPKGVMLTHANMTAAVASIAGYLENRESDIILSVLPLSFDYGLYQVFLTCEAAATLVLERSFVYPSAILDLMERERVTALPVVPTLAALLLTLDLSRFNLALRYVTSTGAALPPAHIAALRAQLPSVRIFSMYGLTECKRVSFLDPEDIDERPGSVGTPMDNVEVFVADDTGAMSPSGVGELIVRGSNVMTGYWRDADLTKRSLLPGPYPGQSLLRSGDRFRIDDEGYMYFIGRIDDLIKSRGQRVSPKEVENVLYELTGVRNAAVIGTPDPILGMAIRAFVVLDPGVALSEAAVLAHCAQRLEDYMVPQSVVFADDLPMTESGKIQRGHLTRSRDETAPDAAGTLRGMV